MDTARRLFRPSVPSYEPLSSHPDESRIEQETSRSLLETPEENRNEEPEEKTSKFVYFTFLMMGCAMLWTYNMFMACATYFQTRFADSPLILDYYSSTFLAIFSATNLISITYFSSPAGQKNANYGKRILDALNINIGVCTALAFSAIIWTTMPVGLYYAFILFMVFLTGSATGLIQNGVFSFVSTFGSIYTQAIMTGQAISGVLPAIAQIISVLAVPTSSSKSNPQGRLEAPIASSLSAFLYFMIATIVCAVTYICSRILIRRRSPNANTNLEHVQLSTKDSVPFTILLLKLRYYAFAIFFTFATTMLFPIYTQAIYSVRPPGTRSRIFEPDVFIPVAFFLWNSGDLLGRMVCAFEFFRVSHPKLLATFSLCRLAFIPLYMMCNIKDQGAVINSDLFYWLVELSFGFTNGWLGSCAMMSAPEVVSGKEKEASGGFMSTCLVIGLTVGSIVSFFVL